jgi:hypothetical protein
LIGRHRDSAETLQFHSAIRIEGIVPEKKLLRNPGRRTGFCARLRPAQRSGVHKIIA